MLILALDSTSAPSTAAVYKDGRQAALYTIVSGNTHSETLLPMISHMLGTLGLRVDDVDAFACSVGPGSFTGVRIGVAAIKGLAFGTHKPCVGVSTLEALAENLRGFGRDGVVVPLMNARRGQVYTATFDARTFERLTPDRAVAAAELARELEDVRGDIIINGDGDELLEGVMAPGRLVRAPEHLRLQNAFSVAVCAARQLERGGSFADTDLKPAYLRMSQAERERNDAQKLKGDR